MNDTHQEGVIKFHVDYRTGPSPEEALVRPLNAWRGILRSLGLIGQAPERYGGLGYGNLSRRSGDAPDGTVPPFVVSGSQTGYLRRLGAEHYCTVRECRPGLNEIVAEGMILPSSETLTHGAVYAAAPHLGFVFHVHSPEIWSQAEALGLPVTEPDVAYGTRDMADAVARLFRQTDVERLGAFAMAGHTDGVVSFGATAEGAGTVMISLLARARERLEAA